MDVKTILGVTSAIVGAGVVVGQDPSFEYPGVKPVLTSGSDSTAPIVNCAQDQQKRVSVKFKNAKVSEVLDWLENQGVNFVTTTAPKDARINLSVDNVPLDEVVSIIGNTLGGNFQKHGSTYVFQRGEPFMRMNFAGTDLPKMIVSQDFPKLSDLPQIKEFSGADFAKVWQSKKDSEQDLRFDLQDQKQWEEFHDQLMKEFNPDGVYDQGKLSPEGKKKLESMHKDLMKKFGPGSDFQKHMELFQKQHAKEMESFGKQMQKRFGDGSEFQKKMELMQKERGPEVEAWQKAHAKEMEAFGKQMEKRFGDGSEFQKKMEIFGKQQESMGKDMEKRFGPGSEFLKKMELFQKEHAKEMQGLGMELQKKMGPGSDFEKQMRAFKLQDGKLRELDSKEREKMMKDMEIHMKSLKDLPKIPEMDMQRLKELHDLPRIPATPRTPGLPGTPGALFFQTADITSLAKSLTPAQREKNKSQGFLYWSDLTKEQQSRLGIKDVSGNWSITYSKEGETFTVKSDK